MHEHATGVPESRQDTAQDLFKHLTRDLIGRHMRDLGFRGTASRGFWIQQGDYVASMAWQKNRHNSDREVGFWIHLTAMHEPANSVYWHRQLHWLIPEMTVTEWTVAVGSPVEPVAESILDGFDRYGWPALQAALPPVGAPPDPDGHWARTFPPRGVLRYLDGPPALEPIAWALEPTGRSSDRLFAELNDEHAFSRGICLDEISELADEPRAVPVLLDRLQHDPSPGVRERCALLVASRAHESPIRQVLQSAAERDQDVQVRWASRYAMMQVGPR
jgi:hypothetical protein